MSTDLNLLKKGLIRLGFLILLFIASPIIITMGFKATEKFTESPEKYFSLLLISLGCFLLIFTIYFAFKTFKVLKDAIFSKN